MVCQSKVGAGEGFVAARNVRVNMIQGIASPGGGVDMQVEVYLIKISSYSKSLGWLFCRAFFEPQKTVPWDDNMVGILTLKK